MHNKKNLIMELEKIDKVIRSNLGGGVYKKILVIDATTGQNGMQQAEVFHEAIGRGRHCHDQVRFDRPGRAPRLHLPPPGYPFPFSGVRGRP